MPSGPSNSYALSTGVHGIRRRIAASASRARVSSFSLTSISWSAASHSCADTIGGVFIGSPSVLLRGLFVKTFNISVEYLFPSTSRATAIVNKMVEDQVLDRAYAALADPTRRRLLETLRQGDARITDLAAPLPMTFAGVSRHVGVLESAGLVRREVRGREHWLSLQPDGLTMAQQWINEQTDFWSTRADALSARLRRKGHAR